MGDASKIHPVLIVLALVIGERTWGLVGALLAVPVASVVVAIFRFLHRKLASSTSAPPSRPRCALRPPRRTRRIAAPRTKGSSP